MVPWCAVKSNSGTNCCVTVLLYYTYSAETTIVINIAVSSGVDDDGRKLISGLVNSLAACGLKQEIGSTTTLHT